MSSNSDSDFVPTDEEYILKSVKKRVVAPAPKKKKGLSEAQKENIKEAEKTCSTLSEDDVEEELLTCSTSSEDDVDEELYMLKTSPFTFTNEDEPNAFLEFEYHELNTAKSLLKFIRMIQKNASGRFKCALCDTYPTDRLKHMEREHRSVLLAKCPICQRKILELSTAPNATEVLSHFSTHSKEQVTKELNSIGRRLAAMPPGKVAGARLLPKKRKDAIPCGPCQAKFVFLTDFRKHRKVSEKCKKMRVLSSKLKGDVSDAEEEIEEDELPSTSRASRKRKRKGNGKENTAKTTNEKPISVNVEVPDEQIPLLMGRSGANMKAIEDRTNTKIEFSDKNDKTKLCKITGLFNNVKEARGMVLNHIRMMSI